MIFDQLRFFCILVILKQVLLQTFCGIAVITVCLGKTITGIYLFYFSFLYISIEPGCSQCLCIYFRLFCNGVYQLPLILHALLQVA